MAEPLCSYFGECGGCSLQHVDYEKQIEQKKKIVENSIKFSDIQVFSDKPYNYRNRMDFIFGKNMIGSRKKHKWYHVVDTEKCVIANERINELLKEVRDAFLDCDSFDLNKQTGAFKFVVIRCPSLDSSVTFILNEKSSKLGEAVEKIKGFAKKTSADNILVAYADDKSSVAFGEEYFAAKGKDMVKEKLLEKNFSYYIQGFFQNNTIVAEKMQKYCHDILSRYDTKNAHLLDLYGGVGTFGIMNADLFKSVTIIESVKSCIDAANINIKENNIKNASALVLDAAQLKKIKLPKPLFVITDPPRTGMDNKTIEELKKLKPEVIIYISCNVQQLGKDILKFKQYKIKSAAIFDLFPQTPHIEAIVELVSNQ